MTDRRLHRLYRHFQELPLSMRTLFTGTLLVIGMGYMFGLIYVYAQDAGRDGEGREDAPRPQQRVKHGGPGRHGSVLDHGNQPPEKPSHPQ